MHELEVLCKLNRDGNEKGLRGSCGVWKRSMAHTVEKKFQFDGTFRRLYGLVASCDVIKKEDIMHCLPFFISFRRCHVVFVPKSSTSRIETFST
jgi:hypothetical protein